MVARKSAVVLAASSVLGALVLAVVFRFLRRRKKQSGPESNQATTPTRTASKQGARARPASAQGSPNDATAATHGTRLSRPVKPPRVPSASTTTPASAESTTSPGRISPTQNAPAARRKVVKRTGPRPAPAQRPSPPSQPGAAGLIPAAPAVASASREPSSTPSSTPLAANVRSVRQPATVGKPHFAEPSTPAPTQQQQPVVAVQDHPIREAAPVRPKTGAVAAIAAEMAATETSQRLALGHTAAPSAGPVTPLQPVAQTMQEHVEPRAQSAASPAVPETRLAEPAAFAPTSKAPAASTDDLAPASQSSAEPTSAAALATALSTDQSQTGAAAQTEATGELAADEQQASTANDAAQLDIVAGLDMPSLDAAAAASVDSEVLDMGKPAASVAASDAAKADKPEQVATRADEEAGKAGVDTTAATINAVVPEASTAALSQAAADFEAAKGTASSAEAASAELTTAHDTSIPGAAATGAAEPEPASTAVEAAEDLTAADLTPTDDAAAAPAADAVPPGPATTDVKPMDTARQLGADSSTERSHEDASLMLADAIEAADADADAEEPVAAAAGPIATTDSLSASTTGGAREASAAPVAPTAEAEASGVTGRRPSPDIVPQTEPDTPPKRVSLAPTVHAAEAAKQQRPSTRSSSSSKAGGSSSRADSSSSGSRKMTVADVIRESIKLKKSNERLKQQLNIKSGRKSSNSGRTSSSSKSVPVTADTKTAATGVSSSSSSTAAAAAADKHPEEEPDLKRAASVDDAMGSQPDQAPMSSKPAAVVSKRPDSAPALSGSAAAATDSNLSQTQPAAAAAEADLAAETPVAATAAAGDSNSVGNDAEPVRSSRRDRSSASNEQQQQPSLSSADLLRELRSMKSENVELVKLLTAQLQEVRAQNAELMAAFHRGGPSLTAVQEETEGSGTRSHHHEGGNSTPTTGSELGTFKDRLRVPHLPRAGSITAGSDAGSSLRSAPAGMAQNTPTKSRSGLWRWASGGRRVGGAMTADNLSVGDNASIPDTLASPRSNISIPVETLVDLLNWGAR